MKSRMVFVLMLVLTVGSLNSSAAGLQDDASMQSFWAKFKSAVIAGDKTSVAAMTQFPVEMPYGMAAVRSKQQLLKRYRQVFAGEANAVKCFATANPTKDTARPKEFTVGCDNGSGQEVVIYGFVWTKNGWKFNSLDNINE
jgi:hypothetical protein